MKRVIRVRAHLRRGRLVMAHSRRHFSISPENDALLRQIVAREKRILRLQDEKAEKSKKAGFEYLHKSSNYSSESFTSPRDDSHRFIAKLAEHLGADYPEHEKYEEKLDSPMQRQERKLAGADYPEHEKAREIIMRKVKQ